ncbi:serine/threonine-protein kinase [Sorangium sp. So ce233]|uniref:serine/threonine-protein kinase n=1 Tax=Sorangium sp. So ce233 TaxID=3133290 RepID=UPI003F63A097
MISPEPAPERLPVGHRVASRYTVESVIGEGASGVVYRAARDEDGRRVALKVIHKHLSGTPQIFRRYHREAAILRRVEGPHVVRMLDFVEEDGLLAIALEHIDGSSLEELLQERAPIAVDLAIEIAVQICAALETAHAAGVIHRDLKPANVLIDRPASPPDGPDGAAPSPLAGRVRVVDFGLAKVVHGEQMSTGLTEQDMIFGTPEYMAPEQVRGEDVDPRCDVYALGCILYEMVVGAVPFSKRTPIAVMTAQIAEQPLPPRSSEHGGLISAGLEAVILRALAKDPAERHPSARAFADALRACRERRFVGHSRASLASLHDAISITELELERTGLDHAAAAQNDVSIPDVALPAPSRESAVVRVLPEASAAVFNEASGNSTARVGGSSRERILWIVVAILCAVAGIAVGTLIGAR